MKIRVKFSKHGAMKFIGHLDIMRYFQKAIRRAEIPIVFTEGFSPHMVMSFASPLGVGIESEGEYMDIEIKEPLSTEEAVRRLDAVMSEGMRILDFRQIPEEKASNAMALVAAADYRIRFREGYEPDLDWKKLYTAFLEQPSISIIKKTKKKRDRAGYPPADLREPSGRRQHFCTSFFRKRREHQTGAYDGGLCFLCRLLSGTLLPDGHTDRSLCGRPRRNLCLLK